MKKRRKVAFRKKKQQNKFGMALVSLAVLMLLVVVQFKSVELRARKQEYIQREIAIQKEIDAENARTEELEELEKYTKTKKYVEEVAKDKLGLVYDDEIIFKYEN